MKIAEQKIGNNVVLEVMEPRLVADQAGPFKEAVGQYFTNGPANVVLDLGQVEFIDSTGLGAILSVLKRMPKGSELLVCKLNEPVSNMFMLTRMDRVFTICKTVNEAVTTLTH
ncbi:MAG TPA: STAS domain-containing protein [Acidobacteriaceae bacterium]|nr:STAS domain-containing protein [Acidobacteriaceae bacterium]